MTKNKYWNRFTASQIVLIVLIVLTIIIEWWIICIDISGVNQSTNWLFPFVFRYRKPRAQSLYSTCLCLSVFLYFTIFSQFILLLITPNQRLNLTSLKQYMNVLKCHQFLAVVYQSYKITVMWFLNF